jgi:hypothetical protein
MDIMERSYHLAVPKDIAHKHEEEEKQDDNSH